MIQQLHLGIYPKKTKTLIQKVICSPMFIVAIFTVAKIWKQPTCPSITNAYICVYICVYIYTHIHWNFNKPLKMKSCHLQEHEWI